MSGDCRVVSAVDRTRERAYLADDKADSAGLLLAEALLSGVGDVGQLLRDFAKARQAAHDAWCAYSDALDAARSVPA